MHGRPMVTPTGPGRADHGELACTHDPRGPRWGRLSAAIVALAAIWSVLFAPIALAGKPERLRLSPFESFVEPPGVACTEAIAPQGVRVADAGGNAAVTFFDSGKTLFTARHPDEITNVATGTSIVLELQGSGASIPQLDGSVELRLSGTTSFTFFPGDLGPGDIATGRTHLFTGNVTLAFGSDGSIVAFESTGTIADVCAMIA